MSLLASLPPVHHYLPLIVRETFSRRTLERRREPTALTEAADHVTQYDEVLTTKLAIAYALGIEAIYRCRQQPYGGNALDIACGPGHMSLCMTKYLQLDKMLGVDLSPPMVEMATGNANKQNLPQASFALANATNLEAIDDASIDLCTFCDAAHHMIDPDVAEKDPHANEKDIVFVAKVLREMDRVTKPEGLVFVMDLVRFKTSEDTEKYVDLLGGDYQKRGLSSFYDDFYNSMYAAWTLEELANTAPVDSPRKWFQWSPRGLSSTQFVIGVPKKQAKLLLRSGLPWAASDQFPASTLQAEWKLARRSLSMATAKRLVN